MGTEGWPGAPDQPGRQGQERPRVSGQVARLRHRHHTARGTESVAWPKGAQWMERERREAGRGPLHPAKLLGQSPPEMRILGNGGGVREEARKRGKASTATAVASGGTGAGTGTAEVHAGRSRGGEGQESAPPGAAGPVGGRRAGPPPPLWASSRWPGRAGVGPSSLLLHAASLAQRPGRDLVSGSPPARTPELLAFPGGGVGVSYKGSCGCLERALAAASHGRAVPGPGPPPAPTGAMSRGAVSPPGLLIWKELERPFC